MQISIEAGAPLEKRITVTIPAESVEECVVRRLREMARSVRLPGFRPGKAPMSLIERRYGSEALVKAYDELINESYPRALTEQGLRPVGNPEIEISDGGRGAPLVYVATIEVYPEFEPAVAGQEVTRRVAEVTDADVERTLDVMRNQRREYETVERPAREEDRLTIDFEGMIGGVPFAGGHAQDYPFVLGSSRILPEFNEALVGAKAGDDRTVELRFPDDYSQQELAGKEAVFSVQVKSVAEPRIPTVDADFARSLGIEDGSVERLRQEVRENLEREVKRISRAHLKAQVLDLLLAANQPDLPKRLVEQETERLQAARGEAESAERLTDEARRRVALVLIMTEIARRHQLRAERAEVMQMAEEVASQYEDSEEVFAWYTRNPEHLQEIEARVLEEKVVDWVLERVTLKEEPVTFNQMIGREPLGQDAATA